MTSPKKKDGAAKEHAKSSHPMRDSAEKNLADSPEISLELKKQTPEQLIHELQVHQIELENQAEELRRAQLALEESRDRYLDLYEFAPIGYLTLNKKSLVNEANLTAAMLLGVERSKLIKAQFSKFIAGKDSDQWHLYFANVLKQDNKQTCTLMIKRGDGSVFHARLEGVRTSSSGGETTVRIAFSDITDIWQIEALRKSEEKFRNVFDWANDAILLHTLTTEGGPGRFIETNLIACRMLGYSREELLTMGPPDIVPPELHPQLGDIIRQAQKKDTFLLETRLRRKDGTTFPVESSGHLVNYEGNQIWISHIRDITERKNAEKTVQKLLQFQNSALMNANVLLFVIDSNGIVKLWNKAAEMITGYLAGEVVGSNAIWRQLYPENEYRRQITGKILSIINDNNVLENLETTVRCRNGNNKIISWNTRGMTDETGKISGYIAIGLDITGRREAEEAVKSAYAYNRSLIEASLDPLVTINPEGKITDVNEATIRATGVSRDILIGSDFSGYFTETDKAAAGYRKVLAEGSVRDYPLTLRQSSGTTIDVLYNASVYRNRNGELQGVFAAARDITERKKAEKVLLSLAAIVENSDDAIIGKSLDGIILSWNTGAENIYGYSASEVIGRSISMLVPAEGIDDLHDILKKVISGEPILHYETTQLRKDGRSIEVSLTVSPIKDRKGAIIGMSTIARDITERKKAEEALRQANAYHRGLIETSLDPFVTIGPDGKITDANVATEVATGHLREQLIGTDFSDYFTEPEKARAGYLQVFREGQVRDYPLVLRHREGHVTPVLYNATVYRDESGNITGIFAAARDITGLRKEERKLKESEERFSQVAGSAGEWIWEVDADGLYTYSSPAVEKMLGYRPDEIVGRMHFYDLFIPEVKEGLKKTALEAFATKEPFKSFVNQVLHKNGTWVIVETSGVPRLDRQGRLIGYRGADTDITARKNAEDALLKSRTQYKHLVENISEVILTLDPEGTITYISPVVQPLFGYTVQEVIGQHFTQFVLPEDGLLATEGFRRRLNGEFHPNEFRIITKKGENRYVRTTQTPVMADGAITGFYLVISDITEQRKTEDELRESEEKYRLLYENSMDAIFMTSTDGIIQTANPAACAMLQRTEEDILSIGRDGVVDTTDPRLAIAIQERERTGRFEGELTLIRKDGTRFPGEMSSSVFTDRNGQKRTSMLIRDITERRKAEKALKESEQRYRSLFENANEGIFFTDIETMKFVHANPAICRMLGYSKEELNTMSVADIHPKESLDYIFGEFQKLATGATSVVTDIPCLRKDGKIRMMNIASSRVMMQGRVYLAGLFTDITERKKAEEALQKSRAQYRQLVENISEVILTLDPEGTITYISPVVRRLFGYTVQEVIGQHFIQFVHPEDIPLVTEGFTRRLNGEFSPNEFRIITRDGEVRYVRTTQTPVMTGGTISAFNFVISDITGHREAENALRESEKKYRTLTEALLDPVFIIGQDDTVLYANTRAAQVLNLPTEQILGKSRKSLFPPDIADDQGRNIQIVFDTGKPLHHEAKILFGDREVWQDNSLVPLKDENGKVSAILGISHNITKRKRAEEILQDFNKKLQQGIEEKTATLRESELRHSRLFESSHDAIMTLEPPDWRFTSCNPATVTMFRAQDETSFTAKAPWELSPEFQPDGRPSAEKAIEMIETAVREGSNFFEWTHRRFNGEDFPATVLLTRFEWKGKEILQATVRDISEQKHAEEERRNSERKFRAIFDQTFQFIGLMTPDGTLVEANRTAMEFSGIQESDALGKPFWETPWWTHSGELQEKLRAAVLDAAKGEFVRFEATHMAADGRLHYVDFSLKPVKDEAGRIILLIPEGRDITEQKLAEDKIKASLEEKVLLLREIHHRVKNNLQIIISLVNLQMRQIDDERLKQVMAETQNRVRAMALVHEKLYQSEDISCIDLASYSRFLVSHLFSFYGVDSRQVALDIDIGTIMLDINTAIPLGLIINELASNALKHAFCGGRKGTLSIAVREEGRTLYLTVKSDGIKIPADFDWRHTDSLGLRLVVSLVEQLDGTIELDRSDGTQFTIVVQEKE